VGPDRTVEDRLKDYFLSMEYELLPNGKLPPIPDEKPDLALRNDESIVFMKILTEKEFSDRNSLLKVVLQCSSLLGKANRVYVAMPKIYASTIEGELLHNHGLGLIVYDERRIEESIQPRFFRVEPTSKSFKPELQELKNRLRILETTIESLTNEVARLRSIRAQPEKIKPLSPGVIPNPSDVQAPQELPSFIKDNPWVEILSRRGSETERIAS